MVRARFVRFAAALAGGALMLGGASAMAGKPTTERIPVEDSFADEFLSEACGFPVTSAVSGHVTIRTYGEDSPKVELLTINVGIISTGPGGSIRFRDVGSDMVRLADNGDLVVAIVGQIPFEFTGRLVINDTTGEVLQEPRHSTVDRLADACEKLA